jgi:hypothetical protein
MTRTLCFLILVYLFCAFCGIFVVGCNKTKRYYVTESVAPVTTVSVVFIDPVPLNQRDEMTTEVNNIFQTVLQDNSVTTTTIYEVNVVFEGDVKMNGNKILCSPGEHGGFPGLGDAFRNAIANEKSKNPNK